MSLGNMHPVASHIQRPCMSHRMTNSKIPAGIELMNPGTDPIERMISDRMVNGTLHGSFMLSPL